MRYVISKNPQPEEWLGEHYLDCTHSFNRRSYKNYFMYCNVLKEMPDRRLKIRVFGHRYRSTEGCRIRYVDRVRVRNSKDFKD